MLKTFLECNLHISTTVIQSTGEFADIFVKFILLPGDEVLFYLDQIGFERIDFFLQ